MKRVISLFLCLVMCVSLFSATATSVFAANQAEGVFTVEHTEYKNDRITYTISINPNQTNLIGAIVKVDYDNELLELSSDSGAAGSLNEYSEFAANVTGYYEDGITTDGEEDYAVAYMNPNGFNIGLTKKAFIKVAFTVIGEERPETTVKFFCEEYITDDGNDANDVRRENGKQEFFSHTFFTLDKVENLEVASAQTGLKFTWSFVTGAEEYVIRRRAADESDWTVIYTATAEETEYIDTSRVQGVEYFYTAEAINKYGSKGYDETGLAGMDFGTITEISASPTERGALITWGGLYGAESYTVYRNVDGATDSHGKLVWTKVGDTANDVTSIEDEPLTSGVKYYYTVKAHKGVYNAEASVDPATITFISNASIAGFKLNPDNIIVNWAFVDGAESYEIYKKTEGDLAFEKIGETTENSYTDEAVQPENVYFYQIRSIAANGDGSVLGQEGTRVVKLPFVTNVKAVLGDDHIAVEWSPAELAENYIIYRKTTTGNWIRVESVPATQTSFKDTVVSSGVTYMYAVISSAQGFNTELSEASNSVYFLSAPEIVGVFNGSNGMEFKFKSVEGAQKYNIYRREVDAQFGEPVGTVNQSTLKEYKYVDANALSGIQYVYGVQSVYGDIKSAITESDLACCLDEPKYELEAAYEGVKVSWDAVRGAEEYRVYYTTTNNADTLKLLTTVTGTSYIHKEATSGRKNYYAVEAVCGDTISTKTIGNMYFLSAPNDVKLSSTKSYIQLKWTDILGADIDEYIVYRKVSGETKWTAIDVELEAEKIKEDDKTVTYIIAKDTTVKAGNKYVYTVVSSDGEDFSAKNETGWSISLLKAPSIKSVENAYGGPKITWGKVSGASKYKVYRKTSKSGKWSYVGSTKSTSYVDKSAKSDKKYYYAVTAVSGSDESGYSSTKTVNYLAAPVVKVKNETSTAITVSWGKVSGAQKYEVYRKEGSAKKWTKVKTTTSKSYTDKKVKNGKTYKYMVKAIDGKIVSGYDSDGESIKRLAAPSPVSVKSAKSGVTFKWKKVTGASGYIVYRKTGSGSYKELKKIKGSTKVSYVDKSAKKGKTYTYIVKAYSGSSTSANKSGLKIKDKY